MTSFNEPVNSLHIHQRLNDFIFLSLQPVQLWFHVNLQETIIYKHSANLNEHWTESMVKKWRREIRISFERRQSDRWEWHHLSAFWYESTEIECLRIYDGVFAICIKYGEIFHLCRDYNKLNELSLLKWLHTIG